MELAMITLEQVGILFLLILADIVAPLKLITQLI